MNAASATAGFSSDEKGRGIWLWALMALAVGLAAITSQSIWIDEGLTAGKAGQPTLGAWWAAMAADKGSDVQMPLYMVYMWGFVKVFGLAEFALRSANLPWFVLGASAFISGFVGTKRIAVALVTFSSAFVWYYLDEARPYAMQIGAAMLVFGAVARLRKDGAISTRWLAAFFAGLIALSGSSLLGMVWAGGITLGVLMLFDRTQLADILKTRPLICMAAGLILVLLAGYYLWTVAEGARASAAGSTSASTMAFMGYELLGFGGLGPGRLDIRSGGLAVFAPFAIPLALFACVIATLITWGAVKLWRESSRRLHSSVLIAILLPAVVIIAAGLAMHFRVLARHLAPILPILIILAASGLRAAWSRPDRVWKLVAIVYLALCAGSCVSLRFAARHRKDDYRAAAVEAKSALRNGRVVWWNAGQEGAAYYGVPMSLPPGKPNQTVWLVDPSPLELPTAPHPDAIIISKPDLFDTQGAVAAFVEREGYKKTATLPAFTIWAHNQ